MRLTNLNDWTNLTLFLLLVWSSESLSELVSVSCPLQCESNYRLHERCCVSELMLRTVCNGILTSHTEDVLFLDVAHEKKENKLKIKLLLIM